MGGGSAFEELHLAHRTRIPIWSVYQKGKAESLLRRKWISGHLYLPMVSANAHLFGIWAKRAKDSARKDIEKKKYGIVENLYLTYTQMKRVT